jgi:hypothetical protein
MLEQGRASKTQQKLDNTHEALAIAAEEIKTLVGRNSLLAEREQALLEEGNSLKETLHDCRQQVVYARLAQDTAQEESHRTVEACKQGHLKELAALKLAAQDKVIEIDVSRCTDGSCSHPLFRDRKRPCKSSSTTFLKNSRRRRTWARPATSKFKSARSGKRYQTSKRSLIPQARVAKAFT